MNVFFNGESIQIVEKNLSQLLEKQELLNKTGIAVAVNSAVVPKSQWTNFVLKEADLILVITAAAGG
mgnify:CR=1 FL=1